ncbi:MAG TPA: hypothetical protein VLD86_13950 [Ilumatobacteraceae bacterium]|nr:hypothetical protein [Ilumatobacteraceae bacterium]
MRNLDWDALRAGGGVALMFAVPFSIAARIVAEGDDNSAIASLLSIAAVIGFILGAGIAAWVQRLELPLKHGIICAVGTYVGAQAIFIIVRAIRGNEIRWLAALFNLTVVAVAGLIGGGMGGALQRRGFRPSSQRGAS